MNGRRARACRKAAYQLGVSSTLREYVAVGQQIQAGPLRWVYQQLKRTVTERPLEVGRS